jgi:hypothetical protein
VATLYHNCEIEKIQEIKIGEMPFPYWCSGFRTAVLFFNSLQWLVIENQAPWHSISKAYRQPSKQPLFGINCKKSTTNCIKPGFCHNMPVRDRKPAAR